MTAHLPKQLTLDILSWEELEELFDKGLTLNAEQRADLLKDKEPLLSKELYALWGQDDHLIFEALPDISRKLWHDIGEDHQPANLGGYEILETIGQGGMGTVYKALQGSPMDRLVAIKVLQQDFSESWRKQFEAEQHLLSRLNHPHVASVFQSGVQEDGTPYLVMEYLEGEPITDYCDRNRLDISSRLKLFNNICEGLHHAHRKGILHCDIKPSNILVHERDGVPVAKLIDFGIARTISGETALSSNWGTPTYMSPQQAQGDPGSLDTGSDLYSLGAVLHELLIGTAPLEQELAEAGSISAQLDLIGQTQAPGPYARLVASGDHHDMAKQRKSTPDRLKKTIRGELDWICCKVLTHDSEAAYQSVAQLHADIERYLNNQPVMAAPEQTWYPVKKWVANHRRTVAAVATVLVLLAISFVVTLEALRETRESNRKLSKVHKFSVSIFSAVDPYRHGSQVKAVELLDDAAARIGEMYADQPALEREVRMALGGSYTELGLYELAAEQYTLAKTKSKAGEDHLLAVRSEAYSVLRTGDWQRAKDLYELGRQEAEAEFGSDHEFTKSFKSGIALCLETGGQLSEARRYYENQLMVLEHLQSMNFFRVAARLNYGHLLIKMREFAAAEKIIGDDLALYQREVGKTDPHYLKLKHNLAHNYYYQRRYQEAEALTRETYEARTELLGVYHPDTIDTLNNLATILGEYQSPQIAVDLLADMVDQLPKRSHTHINSMSMRHNLGHFLKEAGQYDRALKVLNETWDLKRQTLGEQHAKTLITRVTIGEVYAALGNRGEACGIYKEVHSMAHHEDPLYRAYTSLAQGCE